MKRLTLKKMKIFFTACFAFLAIGASALLASPASKRTAAEDVVKNNTLASGVYQTNGASVRVFNNKKQEDGTRKLEETDKKGIRFHVETGADYQIAENTPLLDVAIKSEKNGSYKLADGYKTYTLILPTRLLNGDLTPETDKVMAIDTTEYWFSDAYGNWESVAYVYNVPDNMFTDPFSYRGVICKVDGETETVVASTEISERSLTYVAKRAYVDTIDTNSTYWGSEALDTQAAPLIKKFVPSYNIVYKDANDENLGSEEVLWGDVPANVPTISGNAWYDTNSSEEIDVKEKMNYTANKEFTLVSTNSNNFLLTGVAEHTIEGTTDSGVKVYATLPETALANNTELDINAVNVEYTGSGTFTGFKGVRTMLEGSQMRLFFAFKDGTQLANGDKILIKGDSVFYANGVMYKLTQDYTIDYNGGDDYGMFLGYLYNSDIKTVRNWEEPTEATRLRIRVEFKRDVFINDNFEIKYDGTLPSGYEHPLYIHCEQGGGITPITKGCYYWNDGQHTILELEGYGHHGDEMLYGVPGLKIVQNNGYFIYADAIKWENDGNGRWLEGTQKGTFGANSFEVIGKHASDTTEVRFTTNGNTTLTEDGATIGTTNRWFNDAVTLNVENMSETEPYAVFATNPDGEVTPLKEFRYHGQDIGSEYHHILGFANYEGTVAGETITILSGSRFWCGSEYYTATETIKFYFNGTNWVVNNDGTPSKTITIDNFVNKNYNYLEGDVNRLRMHLVEDASLFNGGNGLLTLECGSVKVNGKAYTDFRYYGQYVDQDTGNIGYHMIFEIIGDNLAPIGRTAFGDTLVIEAGTKLWIGVDDAASTQPYCIEFPETLEWRYVGEGMKDGSGNPFDYEWIRTDRNTNLDHTNILTMYDATDAGGEVRLTLAAGTLTDGFYGFMAMDTRKGVPIVNGIEMPNQAFAYGSGNQLLAVRGGEYGNALESYIIIPEGSVWWTTQGSFTFVETIYGVVRSLQDNGNGNWTTGFNTLTSLGDISAADFMGAENYTEIAQDGTETVLYREIRARISREYSNTYYGAMAIEGEAVVEKANGTQAKALFGQWYSGTAYNADHSIVSFRGDAMIDVTDGDVFTIKAGTKLILIGLGYHTLSEDVVYTFLDGLWQAGNLHATVTYNGTNATVSGTTEALQGDTCTFTATAADGYVITEVIVNGNSLAITANNEYTFTAIKGENEVVVTAKKLYTVTVNADNATVSGIANGEYAVDTTIDFTVTPNTGYHVTSVSGATGSNGSYTVTISGDTTITVTTEINTYTVTANYSGGVSVDAESKTVTHGSSATFELNVPANATIKANGTVINGTSYTVNNVTADTTVTFTTWYNVTVNAGNATVSGDAAGLYQQGDTFDFTVSNTASHTVTGVTVNGNSIGTAAGSYKHTVNGKTDISIATEINTYTVSANCSGGVTTVASKTVTHGSSVTFELNVPENATIKANGTVVNGTSYTVNNVTADTTVTFTTWYNVTVNAGNATVSGDAAGLYQQGDSFDFTVSNTASHTVTGVTVNGNSIATAAGSYNYTVTGKTDISVVAEINTYTVTASTDGYATITSSTSVKLTHGSAATFTLSIPDGATIKCDNANVNISGNTATLSNVTGNTTISFTTYYTITVSTSNASVSGLSTGLYQVGSTVNFTATANQYYYITGVSNATGSNGSYSVSVDSNKTVTVSTERGKVMFTVVTTGALTSGASISGVSTDTLVDMNTYSNVKVSFNQSGYSIDSVSVSPSAVGEIKSSWGTYSGTLTADFSTLGGNNKTVTITVTIKESGCLVEGTMVTLADGTQKAVENLKAGDMLTVFNHETGKYDVAPLLVNTHATASADYYTVITLQFSNGTVLKIADEHAIFSKTANKYVYINESNAYEFIGHEFVSSIHENGQLITNIVTLENVTIATEYTRIFTPVSAWHMNVIADNMLTLSGRTVNFFEYDETMKYDEEKMQADIEKYGLYTYEDFKDYVSEEVFNAFPFKYFKVAIEKGDYTWDELMFLLSEYNESDSEK